jgi:hypothetical protein
MNLKDEPAEDRGGAAPTTYELSLVGEGVTVTRRVTQEAARAIIGIVMGGDIPPGTSTTTVPLRSGVQTQATVPVRTGTPGLSVREYLAEVGARRNPDKIVAIGLYLTEYGGKDTFLRDEVRAQFQVAGEGVPGNYPRDFTWTVRNGWVSLSPGSSKDYYVTNKGREAVGEKFSDAVRKATPKKDSRRRRSRKKEDEASSGNGPE